LPRPQLTGIRALIVDDNATSRRFLADALISWNMRPVTADSAGAALEVLRSASNGGHPYQLLLVDADMPDVSGFGLTEEIRRDPRLDAPVIMMLTAGGRPDDIARCERLGIPWYVLKPVKQSELFDALVMALGIRAPEEDMVAVTHGTRPPRLRELRILLAEDSLVNQKVAVGLLTKHGHSVQVAQDGSEAVDAVEDGEFDLVLMDVQMPEMDGFQATEVIRARERDGGLHLPIIALTAHALKGDRERCIKAGMDDYVAKPINARQLLTTIRDVLGPEWELPTEEAPDQAAAADGDGGAAEIDWEFALSALNGDPKLLRSVVGAALKEAPRLLDHIRLAVSEGDAPGLRIAAHTLKGAVRYFGESRVYDGAYQMEQWGAQERVDFATSELPDLTAEVGRLVSTLKAYLEREEA
jgi:CheY-like chemotaxis protein/HPt (histidine-containing phosphotransfer) domain-containing protein